MPVPATIEVCEKYLFADVNEMAADGIPELIQQRLIRLRDMYNYWLQFPRKKRFGDCAGTGVSLQDQQIFRIR